MKAIKVTYRATFRQPIGLLNPSGWAMSGPCPVEIFGQNDKWQARETMSPKRVVYEKLGRFFSVESGKEIVEQSFAEQLKPWEIWGTPLPDATIKNQIIAERLLIPGVDICDLGDGKWGWFGPEDRTHILHGPTIPAKSKVPPAACGAQVDAKCFISTRGNVEPTCPTCAEVYRKEYANR